MTVILRLWIKRMRFIFVKFLVTTLKRYKGIFLWTWRAEAGNISGTFRRHYRWYRDFVCIICPAETCWNEWFREFWGENGVFFDFLVVFHVIGWRWARFGACIDSGSYWGLRRWLRFENGGQKCPFLVSCAFWGLWWAVSHRRCWRPCHDVVEGSETRMDSYWVVCVFSSAGRKDLGAGWWYNGWISRAPLTIGMLLTPVTNSCC